MIKTIFLTGGNGFIGSHLLKALLESGYRAIISTRANSDLGRIHHLTKKVRLVDASKKSLVRTFSTEEIDCVIHLAAKYIKNHENSDGVDQMIDSNIKFPSFICQLCLDHKVKYFINTGTFFEYLQQNRPLKESSKIVPYNLYAATKLSFLEILKHYANNGLVTVDLKLFAPYGERDNEKLIPFLIRSLVSGDKIDFSGGEQRWNFTYVKDIVEAYLLVLKNLEKFSGFQSFNVGTSKTYSIKQIVRKLENISGKKLNIYWATKPYPPNEIMYANANSNKIYSVLSWKPRYSLESGLRNTFDYLVKQINNG